MNTAPSFRLQLALAAPPAELEAWLAAAGPGHEAIYASGIDLPRGEPAVALVRGWQGAGLVTLAQRRDPADARRFQYLVQRTGGAAAPASPVVRPPNAATRRQAEALARMLLDCVLRGRECPSNNAIAKALDLGGSERGRGRAQYLLRLLATEGRIAVEGQGRNRPRVVTLLTGRGEGRSTRNSGENVT